MKTECPFCNQHYEVEDELIDKVVECPQCKEEFSVQPIEETFQLPPPQSVSNETMIPQSKSSSNYFFSSLFFLKTAYIKHWKIYTGILLATIFVIISVIVCYFSIPNKWRALSIRSNMQYKIITEKFRIDDYDAVKTMCEERAKIELQYAEKENIVDGYISFWCAEETSDFFNFILEVSDLPDEKRKTKHIAERIKEFLAIIETKHPQAKKIFNLLSKIEEEYTPIPKLVIKHNYGRSIYMIKLDEKFSNTNKALLRDRAEKKLCKALYNLYSPDKEIKFPLKLRELCQKEAQKMFETVVEYDEDLAADWAKLILSPEFDIELNKRIAEDGTTKNAFYWLEYFGEKQIKELPYSCQMENFLKIEDYTFWETYYNISNYGRNKY